MRKSALENIKRQGFAAQLMQPRWLTFTVCLWLISTALQATEWQAHKDIYQAVDQFSQQELGGPANITKFDERSR